MNSPLLPVYPMFLDSLSDVTSMVKQLQLHGYEVQTPRLCFVGTNGSGVRTVTESILGLNLIPYRLHYPLEIRFVHVSNNAEIWCSLSFNQKRYNYSTAMEHCRKDILDHVKSTPGDRVIMTVESSRVPDIHVIEYFDQDVSKLGDSDIGIIVIAANNLPDDIALSKLKRGRYSPIGVLTKLDLGDSHTVSRILIDNVIDLPFQLIGVTRHWLTSNPVYSKIPPERKGLDTLMKKLRSELIRRFVDILKSMEQEILMKRDTLRIQLEQLVETMNRDNQLIEYPDKIKERKNLEEQLKFFTDLIAFQETHQKRY